MREREGEKHGRSMALCDVPCGVSGLASWRRTVAYHIWSCDLRRLHGRRPVARELPMARPVPWPASRPIRPQFGTSAPARRQGGSPGNTFRSACGGSRVAVGADITVLYMDLESRILKLMSKKSGFGM